jgi:hypothetical protein
MTMNRYKVKSDGPIATGNSDSSRMPRQRQTNADCQKPGQKKPGKTEYSIMALGSLVLACPRVSGFWQGIYLYISLYCVVIETTTRRQLAVITRKLSTRRQSSPQDRQASESARIVSENGSQEAVLYYNARGAIALRHPGQGYAPPFVSAG